MITFPNPSKFRKWSRPSKNGAAKKSAGRARRQQRQRLWATGENRRLTKPRSPIDLKNALEQTLGDGAFLKKLLLDFIAAAKELTADMARAAADGNGEDIHRDAHKIKGTAANLYIGQMSPDCGIAGEGRPQRRSGRCAAAARGFKA